ncbi:MAG: VPLPA-CTERM sorting domain-containing protein, partial [Pseudomonadota bacterium]|nr:VPLPA-CTERM sorting domain-containing protein [Pseudomonadota bacterium]
PTSITFTSDDVDAVYGHGSIRSSGANSVLNTTNMVPIPGALWLLSSGLFGLVCIRRKSKS